MAFLFGLNLQTPGRGLPVQSERRDLASDFDLDQNIGELLQ